jgi:hypothetical protein
MTFSEIKLFQVKPDKLDESEKTIKEIPKEQKARPGCVSLKYFKRFYVLDKIPGSPRELTKIVKCVKYFSYWEFASIKEYSEAGNWFFEQHSKRIFKLLIMQFDINPGETLV